MSEGRIYNSPLVGSYNWRDVNPHKPYWYYITFTSEFAIKLIMKFIRLSQTIYRVDRLLKVDIKQISYRSMHNVDVCLYII